MRSVDDDLGVARYAFETSGPFGLGDPGLNRGSGHAEFRERHRSSAGVVNLVLTGERTGDGKAGDVETAAFAIDLRIGDGPVARLDQADAARLGGSLVDHAIGLGTLRRDDCGNSRLQDAGLLERDGFDAASQPGFVVEVNRRDDAKF